MIVNENSENNRHFSPDILRDVKSSILVWCDENRRTAFDTRWRLQGKAGYVAFNNFWQWYKEQIGIHNALSSKEQRIKEPNHTFLRAVWESVTIEILPRQALEQLRSHLVCDGEGEKYVRQVVRCMTGDSSPVTNAVFSHWLWQVKRAIYYGAGSACNHILPILYEPEGGAGKSQLVSRLITPLNDWALRWDCSQLADDRQHLALGDNFIVVLDEMSKAERQDADALKRVITDNWLDVRRLGSNTYVRVPQLCSFIGTSNKQLPELIVDSTNMRRFFQINCTTPLNWSLMDEIDYLALWRSINENREHGYLVGDLTKEVRKEQVAYRTDWVESFVEEMRLKPAAGDETCSVSASELFRSYRIWCEQENVRPPTNTTFGRTCKRWFESGRNSRGIFYLVAADNQLPSSISIQHLI